MMPRFYLFWDMLPAFSAYNFDDPMKFTKAFFKTFEASSLFVFSTPQLKLVPHVKFIQNLFPYTLAEAI